MRRATSVCFGLRVLFGITLTLPGIRSWSVDRDALRRQIDLCAKVARVRLCEAFGQHFKRQRQAEAHRWIVMELAAQIANDRERCFQMLLHLGQTRRQFGRLRSKVERRQMQFQTNGRQPLAHMIM